MSIGSRNPTVAGILALLLLAGGCSVKGVTRPQVEGQVTCNGQPVADRTLTLWGQGPDGDFFAQKLHLRADGSFKGEVPAPGNYRVVIEESLAAQEGAQKIDPNRVKVPEKYEGRDTTDLVWTIGPGQNTRDFDLKD